MPARRERLYVCPSRDGEACRVLDVPRWWEAGEILRRHRAREVDTGNPIYVDLGVLLTGAEARAWLGRCREHAVAGGRAPDSATEAELQRWETALADAPWVVLESTEWESGLD